MSKQVLGIGIWASIMLTIVMIAKSLQIAWAVNTHPNYQFRGFAHEYAVRLSNVKSMYRRIYELKIDCPGQERFALTTADNDYNSAADWARGQHPGCKVI